jgi:flagellar basal-body rod protein FlgB
MAVIPSQFDLLAKLTDVTQLRQQVLAQNVANVNTPGYRRLDVHFEEALAEQLAKRPDSSAGNAPAQIIEDQNTPTRPDGNNVEIDLEMMRLNKNTLLGSTYLQLLATKLAMMKRAVSGRSA